MNGSTTHLSAVPSVDPAAPMDPVEPDEPTVPVDAPALGAPTDSRSPRRQRAEHAMPTDRMKKETQFEVLKAFAAASRGGSQGVDASGLKAQMPMIAETTLTLNNAFFHEMGLIERTAKGVYKPVPAVLEFARKYGFNKDEAGRLLGPVLRNTWAYDAMAAKLEMGPSPKAEMVESLAVTARADVSYVPQLRTLLEWFEFAGLVRFDDELVALADVLPASAGDGAGEGGGDGTRPPEPAVPKSTTKTGGQPPVASASGVNVGFSATMGEVSFTITDLARLTPEQIKAVFDGMGSLAVSKVGRP